MALAAAVGVSQASVSLGLLCIIRGGPLSTTWPTIRLVSTDSLRADFLLPKYALTSFSPNSTELPRHAFVFTIEGSGHTPDHSTAHP